MQSIIEFEMLKPQNIASMFVSKEKMEIWFQVSVENSECGQSSLLLSFGSYLVIIGLCVLFACILSMVAYMCESKLQKMVKD